MSRDVMCEAVRPHETDEGRQPVATLVPTPGESGGCFAKATKCPQHFALPPSSPTSLMADPFLAMMKTQSNHLRKEKR